MGAQRSSFSKLQRDRDKKAKAAAKRERRQTGLDDGPVTPRVPSVIANDHGGELSAAELMAHIDLIHQQFDAGTIDFATFEQKKVELLARLPID